MASCDDDFTLLDDVNPTSPNPNPSSFYKSFTHLNNTVQNDVVSPLTSTFSDTPSFHVINPYPFQSGREEEQLSDSETPTPSSYNKRSRIINYYSSEKSGSGSGNGEYNRKDREEWSDTAIDCLLDVYTEKLVNLNRGNLRGRDWEEVAGRVSERCEKQCKSVEQCKNKVDNLKKRYKLERGRLSNGGISVSHWPWFKQMEGIVGSLGGKGGGDEDNKVNGGSRMLTRGTKRYGATVANGNALTNVVKPKPTPRPRWRRVVFKISGDALAGDAPHNIDPKVALLIAREVSIACRLGVEVAIVVGGRNFFCGDTWVNSTGLDRSTAYHIGMIATVMNSILLQSAFEKLGVQARVQSTFSMPEFAESYNRQRAIRHLEKGRVVIFGGVGAGTGNPLFSTDTAAALRASEIHADVLLKGTNIDDIYVCGSRSGGVTSEHISFKELNSRDAPPMELMAVSYCEENGISVVIFNLHEPGNISRALSGERVGTLIDQTGNVG